MPQTTAAGARELCRSRGAGGEAASAAPPTPLCAQARQPRVPAPQRLPDSFPLPQTRRRRPPRAPSSSSSAPPGPALCCAAPEGSRLPCAALPCPGRPRPSPCRRLRRVGPCPARSAPPGPAARAPAAFRRGARSPGPPPWLPSARARPPAFSFKSAARPGAVLPRRGAPRLLPAGLVSAAPFSGGLHGGRRTARGPWGSSGEPGGKKPQGRP